MRPVRAYSVRPRIPDRLIRLNELAFNLRWSWDHETIALFRRLDRDLWETSGHNPALMLGSLPQDRLDAAAGDEAFLAHLDRCAEDLDEYMAGAGTWYRRTFGPAEGPLVAYFSMEFGLTECLPIYSGGLGILAGDHLKSASELGVPLIGVGLLYQKGYFRQYLNPEGWQQERYPVNDFHALPIRPCADEAGKPLAVRVDLAGQPVAIRVWRAQVGRVTLVLLDTNLPENPDPAQDITDELYGGDTEMRIRQELVLGVGGIRALEALRLSPPICHMNEGHSAFVNIERIRLLMKEGGLSLREAFAVVKAGTVFTTHTPVPAGIDVFAPDLVDRYFGARLAEAGLDRDTFLGVGRIRPGDAAEPFNMAVLAIRTAGHVNGVSRLHGRVSRRMWQEIWPGVPEDELPIAHVTNGVHAGSWISEEMRQLYARYLGPRWIEEPGDTEVWSRFDQIPAEELWRSHERRRERLVAFARRRLVRQCEARGAGREDTARAAEALDPEALTIGFARRFATYKRGTLLLRDFERLGRILNASDRPVQVLYAGKSHPRDEQGKSLIRDLVRVARGAEFRRRIVFLEDYDQTIARYMVQGVDVWLNTPRRPMEASGTSGMKAAINGALNLSVLDGWWDEAWTPKVGWAIGTREEYRDFEEQDRAESGALYDLLEREVVPLFYARGSDGLPRGWIDMMKASVATLGPVFNTNRMVHQYTLEAYRPALDRRGRLEADGFRGARALAAWRGKVREGWPQVRISGIEADIPDTVASGDAFEVRARVRLGSLSAGDVEVQVYHGRLDDGGEIVEAATIAMEPEGGPGAAGPGTGELLFRARVPCRTSGRRGLTVRVLPRHEDLGHPHDLGLIVWGA